MTLNKFSKRAFWCGLVIGALVALILPLPIIREIRLPADLLLRAKVPEKIVAESASVSLPVDLRIPKIKVDARIESLGLTPGGALEVPVGPENVSWYNLGVRPGEVGNAVLSGHYGWKDNIPAVFDSLSKVDKGDELYIEDERGGLLTFVVREIRTYHTKENPSETFTSTDGRVHLVLITCGGEWNNTAQSYANRVVVFADMEPTSE